jgi:hypothetical protein
MIKNIFICVLIHKGYISLSVLELLERGKLRAIIAMYIMLNLNLVYSKLSFFKSDGSLEGLPNAVYG